MARSVVFNGTSSAATVALPNSSPYNAIGDFRVEVRVHNLAAQTGTLWRNDHYALTYNTSTGNLSFFDLANLEAVSVSLSGKTDFKVRCRRVSSTGEISIEVWDTDDTNRVAQTTTFASTGTKNWSTTASYSFAIGATREPDTSTYSWQGCQIAWFRGRDAAGGYNTTAPADADAAGNLFNYEFEDTLNDTSGNGKHLTAVGTPTYATTPGSSGPPEPPAITLTPTSGQIAVSGSSPTATGYKVYRRLLKGSYNYAAPLADVSSLPYNDTTIANDRRYFYEVRAYNASGDSSSSTEKVSSFHTPTVIDTENALTGTSSWQLTNPAAAREIEGYASLTSVNKGSAIDFCISSSQANYTIDIYRMGYYAGLGGRQIGSQISKTNGTVQAMPTAERNSTTPSLSRELVTCAWSVSHSYTVPSDAVSGIYLAKLTQTTSTKQSYIIFCVRDDSRSARLLYIQPVTTYQAYNNWGGKSLYTLNSVAVADTSDPLYGITMNSASQARAVSFFRPYAVTARTTRTNGLVGIGAGDFLTMQSSAESEATVNPSGWELDTVMWLESQGLDVKYITNVDQHTTPSLLTGVDVVLSAGHDEYWSQEMRDNVIAARNSGVHLSFLGANSAYWQIRFEDSNRTVVAWKEGVQNDPETNLLLKTALWRFDVTVPTRTGRPEESFVGVMWKGFNVNSVLTVKTATAWPYQGLTLSTGTSLGSGLVGYEFDMVINEASSSPAGLIQLFELDFSGGIFHHGTVYEHASGAIIFASGTNQFSWALASAPHAVTAFRTNREQANVKHLMLNVLDQQLNTSAEIAGAALFRGRNFPFFDDDQVNRFEFWPAVTQVPTLQVVGTLVPAGVLARSITRALTATETPVGVPVKLNLKPLSGAEVPAGLVLRQSQRQLTGAQTPSASLVRSLTRALIGLLVPIGIAVKGVSRHLTGIVIPSGSVSSALARPLTGSLGPAGLITKLLSTRPSGQLVPVAVIVRVVQTAKSGALTPTSLLVTLKLTLQSLAGSLTPTGLTRQITSRPLFAQITPAAIVSRAVAVTKSAVIAASGTLATLRAILQSVGGTLNPVGALVRLTSNHLSGQLSPSSLLIKIVAVIRTGIITPTGLLVTARAFLLQLTSSLIPSSVIARLTTRPLKSTQSPAGEATKTTTQSTTGSLSPSAILTTARRVLLSLASSLTPTATTTQTINTTRASSIQPTSSASNFVSRLFTAVLSLGGSLVNLLLNPQVKLDVVGSDFAVTQLIASDFPVTRLEMNDAATNPFSTGDSAL
jgi:hypothetical protein